MVEQAIAELEVIHHVDSALALLLTIDIFLVNMLLTSTDGLRPYAAAIYGLAGGTIVFYGLFGILRRNWTLKISSWYFGLLMAAHMFIYLFLEHLEIIGVLRLSAYFGPPIIAYLALKHGVVHAYVSRMSAVQSSDSAKRFETTMLSQCKFFRLLTILLLIWIVFLPVFL